MLLELLKFEWRIIFNCPTICVLYCCYSHGAEHERGRRAGTENVLLAVGLGEGCAAAGRALPEQMEHMAGPPSRSHTQTAALQHFTNNKNQKSNFLEKLKSRFRFVFLVRRFRNIFCVLRGLET